MSLRKFIYRTIAASLVVVASSTIASANNGLERLAVPKSKLISSFWKKNDPSSTIQVDHSAWDAFLGKYLKTSGSGVNLVAYRSVSAGDKKALRTYVNNLQAVDVPTLNRNEQYAYWMNLYNSRTVLVVLDNLPLMSIREIKKNAFDFVGPFNDKVVKVNGKTLTLNDIESGIVRPIWNGPLLHYGFNCAAISCPNLNKTAFKGEKVKAQLQAAARSFINNPRGITINGNKVTASKIYFWYEDDFGGSEKSILNHIRQFASAGLKQKLANVNSIDKYEYNWDLNDANSALF